MLSALLDHNAKLHLQDVYGYTPWHWATFQGWTKGVKTFAKYTTAGIDTTCFGSMAPLHYAVRKLQKEMVRELLRYGANPNVCNGRRQTPLHMVSEECRKEDLLLAGGLLKHVAKVQCQDLEGKTAFHYAAWSGSIPMMKLLLAYKAYLNLADHKGNTPLHGACSRGDERVVYFLVHSVGIHLYPLNHGAKAPSELTNHAKILKKIAKRHEALKELLVTGYAKGPTTCCRALHHLILLFMGCLPCLVKPLCSASSKR